MEKRTEGAWLIHHTKKLLGVTEALDFEDIEFAGKCGMFLSNLAASEEQSDLNKEVVNAIARVSNIKKTEIDTIKNKLADAHLIEVARNGAISVLGVTTSKVLDHTARIFETIEPTNYQKAALGLSENISDLPKEDAILSEYISDTYKLDSTETKALFLQSEQIGFIDYEKLDSSSKLYFNGNLFRRDIAPKTKAVLGSLKADDTRRINQVDELLNTRGCITLEEAKNLLGMDLLSKLQSIGMYDFSEVSNTRETKVFITKPSAFSKFGNPFEEDALDLAKAFVSSLYYGMTFSTTGRGKINMLKALMQKLIRGEEVGPATAIGEDYKLLELKRVIKLRKHGGSSLYFMKLLKKDVGELALQVLEFGDVTEQSLLTSQIYTGSVTDYKGPEEKRMIARKKQTQQTKKSVTELLRTFRN